MLMLTNCFQITPLFAIGGFKHALVFNSVDDLANSNVDATKTCG